MVSLMGLIETPLTQKLNHNKLSPYLLFVPCLNASSFFVGVLGFVDLVWVGFGLGFFWGGVVWSCGGLWFF